MLLVAVRQADSGIAVGGSHGSERGADEVLPPYWVPIVDRSSSHYIPPVSNGLLIIAISVLETSQHLPKNQLVISEDSVSYLMEVNFFICQQSNGA
jgi:hypothetical protein